MTAQQEEGWEPLGDFVRRTDPIATGIISHMQQILKRWETRRTVQVATRKYRARQGRRRG